MFNRILRGARLIRISDLRHALVLRELGLPVGCISGQRHNMARVGDSIAGDIICHIQCDIVSMQRV